MGLPDLSGYSDHQLVTLIVIVWLTTIGGIVLLYLKTRTTGNNAENAAKAAEVAARQTVTTGNGFAKHVLETLEKIRASLEITQRSVEGLQSANDDVRTTLDDVREQAEFLRQRVVKMDDARLRHMEYHLTQKETPDA